jgi:hypothetical protein
MLITSAMVYLHLREKESCMARFPLLGGSFCCREENYQTPCVGFKKDDQQPKGLMLLYIKGAIDNSKNTASHQN